MRILQPLPAIAGLMCILGVPSFGQVAPLRVDDVMFTHSFSDFTPVRFSPDGKFLFYAAGDHRKWGTNALEKSLRTGIPISALGADLFVVQVASGEVTSLTGSVGNNWAPSWSPDGRFLAFLSDRDRSGHGKLWIWEAVTGKMRKASDLFVRADRIQWLPNSREVLLTALPANLTPEQYAQRFKHLRCGGRVS